MHAGCRAQSWPRSIPCRPRRPPGTRHGLPHAAARTPRCGSRSQARARAWQRWPALRALRTARSAERRPGRGAARDALTGPAAGAPAALGPAHEEARGAPARGRRRARRVHGASGACAARKACAATGAAAAGRLPPAGPRAAAAELQRVCAAAAAARNAAGGSTGAREGARPRRLLAAAASAAGSDAASACCKWAGCCAAAPSSRAAAALACERPCRSDQERIRRVLAV